MTVPLSRTTPENVGHGRRPSLRTTNEPRWLLLVQAMADDRLEIGASSATLAH
jgi:hypothetical protein